MESVPRNMDLVAMQNTVESVPGVEAVHHLHVWELGSGVYAMSAHIEVEDKIVSECSTILSDMTNRLKDEFNIVHPTLQIECEGSACPVALQEQT